MTKASTFESIAQSIYLIDDEAMDEAFPCECRPVDGISSPPLILLSNNSDIHPGVPSAEQACGPKSNCINRACNLECNKDECPCRQKCQNQMFQRRQYASVEVFETPGKGFGLRTTGDLSRYLTAVNIMCVCVCVYVHVGVSRDQLVIEYVGEVVDREQFTERTAEYTDEGIEHYYFMTVNGEQVPSTATHRIDCRCDEKGKPRSIHQP